MISDSLAPAIILKLCTVHAIIYLKPNVVTGTPRTVSISFLIVLRL